MYEIIQKSGNARIGQITTKHGLIETPTIFPVHNLGSHAGWNTPRYWELYPWMKTGMFNASYIKMCGQARINDLIEKGLHRYLDFLGIAFVDSGGYIYGKYKLNTNQQQLLELQEQIGADIASTLDHPISLLRNRPENLKISENVSLAKQALLNRKDTEMKLFASIHGYDPLIIRNVIRHLKKFGNFDGFAIGSLMKHFSNFRLLTDLILTVRKEINDIPLHVYGLCGIVTIPLLVNLGVDSVDSSSFIIAASKRDYIIPGFKRVSIKKINEKIIESCKCKICSSQPLSEIISRRDFLSLHNLWALWNEINNIKISIKENNVNRYLSNRFCNNPWALNAFKYAKKRTLLRIVET